MGWSEGRSQSGLRPAAYACNDWSMLNAMRAYDANNAAGEEDSRLGQNFLSHFGCC